MSSPLEGLEPRHIWQHFDGIRKVPRPSKHEEKVVEHVLAWAKDRGFEVLRDQVGNLVIRVPATPGHESAPTVVLQGHLDMVCEKNTNVDFDFMNDPIQVEVEGDWVKAVGTTLGADNGIGVAAGMAIADDPEAVHGPLELLMTLDEETGLTGAMGLDGSMLSGRIMINLDTEEDGAVYIGCAGGADSIAEFPLSRRRALLGSIPARLVVRGLRGGHSGVDIHENRANAIKLAVRTLLRALDQEFEVDLVSLEGGSKHNAIPRESFTVIRLPEASFDGMAGVVEAARSDFADEFPNEPGLEMVLERLQEADEYLRPVNVQSRDRLLHALNGIPHGVLAMSRDVPGLVETSNNLAVITTQESRAVLTTSHRSSVMPALYGVQSQVRSVCLLAGATVEIHDAYPGWKPNPDSPTVRLAASVHERLFGTAPELKAIHAGLECGLLLDKVPGMDIISIGPVIKNPHSPDEVVQISSVARFYTFLKEILAELA